MKLWPKAINRQTRFQYLRHSAGTLVLRAGIDVHRVQRVLRHSDVKLTTSTYARLGVEDLRSRRLAADSHRTPKSPKTRNSRAWEAPKSPASMRVIRL